MKQTYQILFIVLIGMLALLFLDTLSHVIWYHEQHHLFLFTKPYFYSFLSVRNGLSEYIANFFIQFFYYPYMGILLISSFLGLIFLFITSITCRLTGREDLFFLALIPPLYLLIQYESVDYPISHTTSLVISLFLLYLVSLIKRKSSWFLFIPWFLLTGWFLGWLYPFVTTFCILVSCLSAITSSRLLAGKKIQYLILSIFLLIYGGITFYYFVQNYSMRERLLVEAEKGLRNKNWKQVLDCTNKYRGKHPLIPYFRNMALYHTGCLPKEFLTYAPEYGVNSLHLSWTGDSRYSLFGHFLYEELGHINEAHRWVFESMVVFGENGNILLDLIRYNTVNQRPDVARKFINVLKSSLFYRQKALAYEKVVDSGEISGFKKIAPPSGQPVRFANITHIAPELQFILLCDPFNRMAFEYLICYTLIRGDLDLFAKYIPMIKNFDYPSFPSLFEEALWLWQQENNLELSEDNPVRSEIKKEFERYQKLVQQREMKQLQERFGKSYWYYFDYLNSYKN